MFCNSIFQAQKWSWGSIFVRILNECFSNQIPCKKCRTHSPKAKVFLMDFFSKADIQIVWINLFWIGLGITGKVSLNVGGEGVLKKILFHPSPCWEEMRVTIPRLVIVMRHMEDLGEIYWQERLSVGGSDLGHFNWYFWGQCNWDGAGKGEREWGLISKRWNRRI